jgi:threonine dehydrogenase-like Zn-dependent dehydrogenase
MKTLQQMGIAAGKKYRGIGIVPLEKGYIQIERKLEQGGSYSVVCMVVAVGKCSTDKALAGGMYGSPALGQKNIITGHEVVVKVISIIGDNPTLEKMKIGAYYMVVVRQPKVWPSLLFDTVFPAVDLTSNDSNWGEIGLSHYDGGDRPIMICDCRTLIPIPENIKPQHAPLIETGSCPAKAQRLAEALHAAMVGGPEYVDTHRDPTQGQKIAYILGITGACGLMEASNALLSGYKVVGIGRKAPDDPLLHLVHQLGITYVQDDGSNGLVEKILHDQGKARFIFDTTASPRFVDRWEAAINDTGVTVEFGIPEGCNYAAKLDKTTLAEWDINLPPLRRTIKNAVRMGSINASVASGDWKSATSLLAALSDRYPHVLTSIVRTIDGLNIQEIEEYIEAKNVLKPVVLPNGWQATTQSGEPILE